ncbi:MAG: hypothetical protein JXB00_08125 [Bacteroidales bacterium]|nr:hypothetical protein [Bacteroidales bacterium]
MKRAILFVIAIALIACEKENNKNEIIYDFKIIRSYKSADQNDSTVYYYTSGQKLVALENHMYNEMILFKAAYETGSISVTCQTGMLLYGNLIYYTGQNGLVDSVYYQQLSPLYILWYKYNYNGNRLVSAERRNALPEKEYIYLYHSDRHVKDSVNVIPLIPGHYTTISYTYTDTLKPDFMVDESGLFEFPSKSDYLTREIITRDYSDEEVATTTEKYSYTIEDNKLVMQVVLDGADHATVTWRKVEKD